jgi:hypothetical protein
MPQGRVARIGGGPEASVPPARRLAGAVNHRRRAGEGGEEQGSGRAASGRSAEGCLAAGRGVVAPVTVHSPAPTSFMHGPGHDK